MNSSSATSPVRQAKLPLAYSHFSKEEDTNRALAIRVKIINLERECKVFASRCLDGIKESQREEAASLPAELYQQQYAVDVQHDILNISLLLQALEQAKQTDNPASGTTQAQPEVAATSGSATPASQAPDSEESEAQSNEGLSVEGPSTVLMTMDTSGPAPEQTKSQAGPAPGQTHPQTTAAVEPVVKIELD